MRPLALLAHQGGWDEILLVAGPVVLIIAALAVVKRRVDASAAAVATGERAGEDAATDVDSELPTTTDTARRDR